MRIGNPILEY